MTKKNLPTKQPKKSKPAETKHQQIDLGSIANLIMRGDLSGLSEQEKVQYYGNLCKSLGLNPLTKPFDYITFERDGRRIELLYANRNCAEQLRKMYGISVVEEKREFTESCIIYDVKVQDSTGRTDTGTGVVSLIRYDRNGTPMRLSGTALADAIMKAQTKAKRRATLSIAGIGMLDETELDFVYEQKQQQPQQLPNNKNEDLLKRQEMLDKFKTLSPAIKKKLADKKFPIDKQLAICEESNWDETTIMTKLEVEYVTPVDDPF